MTKLTALVYLVTTTIELVVNLVELFGKFFNSTLSCPATALKKIGSGKLLG